MGWARLGGWSVLCCAGLGQGLLWAWTGLLGTGPGPLPNGTLLPGMTLLPAWAWTIGWRTVGGWTMGRRRMIFLSFQAIWGGTVALLYILKRTWKIDFFFVNCTDARPVDLDSCVCCWKQTKTQAMKHKWRFCDFMSKCCFVDIWAI